MMIRCVSVVLLGSIAWCKADDFKVLRGAHVYEAAFENFVKRFNKDYADDSERQVRFAAFKDNYDKIEAHNAHNNNSYRLGITVFADLTVEDFVKTYGSSAPPKLDQSGPLLGATLLGVHRFDNMTALPADVDWRTKGVLTPVKNQGQCGACWAFSVTGAMEAAWQLATGTLVSLSEQQLSDCSSFNKYGNLACGGGSFANTILYAHTTIVYNEASYPYTAQNGKCDTSGKRQGIPLGGVVGYKTVEQTDAALMQAVAQQPVSIAIEADQSAFMLYSGGVLAGVCGSKLDHGVLLVGYGTDNGKDYWLIKNSWASSWGENGYVRILRGPTAGTEGECGILATSSVYPVMDGTKAQPPDIRASLIAGGVLVGVIGLATCFCLSKSLVSKWRGGSRRTAPLLEPTGRTLAATSRPTPITPAQTAGRKPQSSVETVNTVAAGNSRQSRLLQVAA